MHKVEVDLDQIDAWGKDQDWQALTDLCVTAAFAVSGFSPDPNISISISLSDDATVHDLNRTWRDKDKPTNVLSFPMLEAQALERLRLNRADMETLLGDIILAHAVCATEAAEKGIPLPQHISHLIIHGTLHLLGYDHIDDAGAGVMEALEIKALASMALPNPYSDQDQ